MGFSTKKGMPRSMSFISISPWALGGTQM